MMTPDADFARLLNDLAARVPGVEAVVMLRRDGQVVAARGGLPDPLTERLAAIAASALSLAKGATGYFAAGRVVQVTVDLAGRHLLVTPAGDHDTLAVLAAKEAEVGTVVYETTILSRKLSGLRSQVKSVETAQASGVCDPRHRCEGALRQLTVGAGGISGVEPAVGQRGAGLRRARLGSGWSASSLCDAGT